MDTQGRLETFADTEENKSIDHNRVTIYTTDVFDRWDERQQSPLFRDPRKNEIEGPGLRDVRRCVKMKDLPAECNILGGRFT